jgi:hypothetical protein
VYSEKKNLIMSLIGNPFSFEINFVKTNCVSCGHSGPLFDWDNYFTAAVHNLLLHSAIHIFNTQWSYFVKIVIFLIL